MTETGRSKSFWILLGLGIVGALVAGLWLGRPAYRAFKERRALTQARSFLDKGDYASAVLSLRQVLTLNPANAEAVEIMADVATTARSPQMLVWRKRAVELAPSLTNRLLLIAAGLQVESPPYPLTTETLNTLAQTGVTNTEYRLLSAQLALQLQRPQDALRHLEQAAQIAPTNQTVQLQLATLRLQWADAAGAEAARAQLRTLATYTNSSLLALRALADDALRRKDFNQAEQWVKQLMSDAQAGFADRLLELSVLEQSRPATVPAALETTQREAGTNTLAIVTTAYWMISHGRASAALVWLRSQPDELRQSVPLLQMQAEGYLQMRDWPGLEEWLESQNWKDQEYVRLAVMSRAVREQSRNDVANLYWRRAMSLASKQPEAIAHLSRLVAAWDWEDHLEELLWSAVETQNARNDWALQALGNYYQGRTNTAGLYRLHQTLLKRQPQSVPLQNNTALMALLLRRDLEQATTLARSAYAAEQTNAAVASTYAYALHLNGKTSEGLQVMSRMTEAQLLEPSIALYQAVLLKASGQSERAQPYADAARRAPLLLPEEAALLDSLKP